MILLVKNINYDSGSYIKINSAVYTDFIYYPDKIGSHKRLLGVLY